MSTSQPGQLWGVRQEKCPKRRDQPVPQLGSGRNFRCHGTEQSSDAGTEMEGPGLGDGLDRQAELAPRGPFRPKQSPEGPRSLEEKDRWSGWAGHRQNRAVDSGAENVGWGEGGKKALPSGGTARPLRWLGGKESACQRRRRKSRSLGGEDPLEKEMATHSRILACKIPWTEEPGRL